LWLLVVLGVVVLLMKIAGEAVLAALERVLG
jgi:hypothetical protein